MDEIYKKQVSLLLEVLPFVAEEEDLALHGGTALNDVFLTLSAANTDTAENQYNLLMSEHRPINILHLRADGICWLINIGSFLI